VLDSAFVKEYEDIFIKVKEWGIFQHSDIARNGIYDDSITAPNGDFVTEFERMLDRKPGLRLDLGCFVDSRSRAAYFELARTRPSRTNLTRKRIGLCTMPIDLRRYMSHILRLTNGFGAVPKWVSWQTQCSSSSSYVPPKAKLACTCLLAPFDGDLASSLQTQNFMAMAFRSYHEVRRHSSRK